MNICPIHCIKLWRLFSSELHQESEKLRSTSKLKNENFEVPNCESLYPFMMLAGISWLNKRKYPTCLKREKTIIELLIHDLNKLTYGC